ncbi:MAG: PKD domain-containing protein [Phycisphaerae bacterium]|nr:PKD domain-containing protein [Phycisphaerae bacterium]NIX26602.1 PKD domain-containing protein [Phycisphaerae bacterium]
MGQTATSAPRSNTQRRRLLFLILIVLILLLLCAILWFRVIAPIINPPEPTPTPLTANPGGPYTIDEGQALSLDGSGSTGTNITTYSWDFGDGESGDGITQTHTYQDGPNEFKVALTVTDDQGQMNTGTTEVSVNNLPPTADAGGPYSCTVGETITLSGTCNDPSSVDATSLTCTWADFSGATISEPGYTCPATPGEVSVTLTATDKDGASAQDSATVTVNPSSEPNEPPMAVITVYLRDKTGLIFGFEGRSSSDPDGEIVSYEWNFGDGNTGTGVEILHTYAEEINYTVTLTVTDNLGAVATDTVDIP